MDICRDTTLCSLPIMIIITCKCRLTQASVCFC